SDAANGIKNLHSSDGSVLLFNLHLSSSRAPEVEFPNSEAGLADQYAQLLFNISSPLPDYMRSILQQEGFAVSEGAHGFVFNARIESVINFLDIGTRPSNLR